jgi:hypothetical protein
MLDVVAATVDERLQAPRYGDGDDGRALVLGPGSNRWESLLSTGRSLFGAEGWWPASRPDATSTFLSAIGARHHVPGRPAYRPSHFADAGITILRTLPRDGPEIWCRADSGPHGFLSIAAHAHADALSVEVRHAGTDILTDPGTYCYHGEARWRSYFRSTLGHNTLELAGQDQSVPGGPFLWARQAHSRLIELTVDADGRPTAWIAEHDGYQSLEPPATHRRTVLLRAQERRIEITDEVISSGEHSFRLMFHLGPAVTATLGGASARLEWEGPDCARETAWLTLASEATWRLARGESDPVMGWYSPRFGTKQPVYALIGQGTCSGLTRLANVLQFGCSAP